MFTSSFAHVDLLHLAMNMISLYQVGWLEMYYGSFLYAVLSVTLVVLTMVIGMLTYHVMIVYFRKVRFFLAWAAVPVQLRYCSGRNCCLTGCLSSVSLWT